MKSATQPAKRPAKRGAIATEDEYNTAFPLPDPYANNRKYWGEFAQTFVLSVVIGIIGVAFNTVIAWGQHQWWPKNYPEHPETVALKSGEWYWVGITTGAGFLVGLLSYYLLPKHHKGFFLQLSIGDVDYKQAPGIVLVSIISLAGGCSLGPECALAFAGGGIAAWYARRRNFDNADRQSFVLSGMVAAIGAVFPSPVLSVMLMVEMNERKDNWDYRGIYMRSISLLTLAASTSFTIYYGVLDAFGDILNTFLAPIQVDGFSRIFLGISTRFIWTDCLTAAVIGVVSGLIGILTFVIVGVVNKNFDRLRAAIGRTGCHPALVRIIPSTVAGALIGLLAVAMPLTMGSGAEQLPAIIRGSIIAQDIVQWNPNYTAPDFPNFPDIDFDLGLDRFNTTNFDLIAYEESFGVKALLLAALGKMVAFGLARAGGFVGGLIFPLIFIGSAVGMAASALMPNLPWLLSFTCFLAGVPCSIMPAPISAMGIAAFTLAIGPYETAPIFVSAVVAHLTVLGLGIFQKIVPSRLPPANVIIEYENRLNEELRTHESRFFPGGAGRDTMMGSAAEYLVATIDDDGGEDARPDYDPPAPMQQAQRDENFSFSSVNGK